MGPWLLMPLHINSPTANTSSTASANLCCRTWYNFPTTYTNNQWIGNSEKTKETYFVDYTAWTLDCLWWNHFFWQIINFHNSANKYSNIFYWLTQFQLPCTSHAHKKQWLAPVELLIWQDWSHSQLKFLLMSVNTAFVLLYVI